MYDRFWQHLYADEPRLATHEPEQRPAAERGVVNDRVLEAFSRWLEGMEEALDRRTEPCVIVRPRVLPLD
jgi:hypothetical protein